MEQFLLDNEHFRSRGNIRLSYAPPLTFICNVKPSYVQNVCQLFKISMLLFSEQKYVFPPSFKA